MMWLCGLASLRARHTPYYLVYEGIVNPFMIEEQQSKDVQEWALVAQTVRGEWE